MKPVKRRGNRRYYQHHEVLLIRRIRELLYEQGFTISGARNKLDGHLHEDQSEIVEDIEISMGAEEIEAVRTELNGILQLLSPRA